MSNWIEKHRHDLIVGAANGLLSTQIYGQVVSEQQELVTASIDRMKIDDDKVEKYEESELIHALVGEAVGEAEHALVAGFLKNRVGRHPIDFKEIPSKEFIGEKLSVIGDKIEEILATFPDDGENFIIGAPLEISLLQSALRPRFEPALEGDWKGANWSQVVGRIFEATVYSYLFDISEDYNGLSHEFVCDTIIVGHCDSDTQEVTTHIIPLVNIDLS